MLDGRNVVCCRTHNSVSRYEKRHGCKSLRNIRQPPCKVQLMVNVCAHVPVTNVYTDRLIQDRDKIFNLSLSVWPSRWPRSLWRGSASARLLELWIRIPPGGMDVSCGCCVMSGRRLCVGLITSPGVVPIVVCVNVIVEPGPGSLRTDTPWKKKSHCQHNPSQLK